MNPQSMKVFFEPASVAIVGASSDPSKFGHIQLSNLLKLGFKGKVYPVNPNAKTVLGLRSFPNVNAIPDKVDLVIITVPANLVPQVMLDCASKGVEGVIITSSGFSETRSDEGKKREKEIVNIAKNARMRIIGPNTTGVLNSSNYFTTTFTPIPKVRKGPVAFIAQTGQFTGMTLEWIFSTQNFGISKVVGLGNKCDIDDVDVLEYLHLDQETKIILIYMEGIRDGRAFLEVARRVTRKKPIIVLKAGWSQAGANAAISHTGSLGVKNEIFDAACKKAGIIRVNGLEELIDLAKAFAFQPLPRGNRVGVVSLSGAVAVMAIDACMDHGLEVTSLSNETARKIESNMPTWARPPINFVDLQPLTETMGFRGLESSLKTILEDKNVDCVIMAIATYLADFGLTEEKLRRMMSEVRAEHEDKPVLIQLIGKKETVDLWTRILEETGYPTYPSVERCAKTMAALCLYRKCRDAPEG